MPLRDGSDDLYFVPACHNGVNQVGHRKSNLKVAVALFQLPLCWPCHSFVTGVKIGIGCWTLLYVFYVCVLKLLRYDTRCYFNVHSKADMSQLNLPHGNDN